MCRRGFSSITLEGSGQPAGWPWTPRAVARVNYQAGEVTFRLAQEPGIELLRLRADPQESLPEFFYHGPSWFAGQPASDGDLLPAGMRNDMVTAPAGDSMVFGTADLGGGTAIRAVAESDIWKIDRDTLYFFNQYRGLQVIDVSQQDTPVILGTLPLSAAGEQMYLLDDTHVVLLARDGCNWSDASASQAMVVEIKLGRPTLWRACLSTARLSKVAWLGPPFMWLPAGTRLLPPTWWAERCGNQGRKSHLLICAIRIDPQRAPPNGFPAAITAW